MVISDLVSDRKKAEGMMGDSSSLDKWCTCVDGALSKEEYLEIIRKAGFQSIEILDKKLYMREGDQCAGRKISSVTIKADKK
jgi:arsenite methyltransferase